MEKEQLQQIIDETYNFLNNKNVNFICCIWDKDGKYYGGCRSISANMGDALIAIEALVNALSTILKAIKMLNTKRETEKK